MLNLKLSIQTNQGLNAGRCHAHLSLPPASFGAGRRTVFFSLFAYSSCSAFYLRRLPGDACCEAAAQLFQSLPGLTWSKPLGLNKPRFFSLRLVEKSFPPLPASQARYFTTQNYNDSFILSIPPLVTVQIFSQDACSEPKAGAAVTGKAGKTGPALACKRLLQIKGPLGSFILAIPSNVQVAQLLNANVHAAEQPDTRAKGRKAGGSNQLEIKLRPSIFSHPGLDSSCLKAPKGAGAPKGAQVAARLRPAKAVGSQELLTLKAHLLNIFQGVTEGFMIKLNLVGLFYSVRIKRQEKPTGNRVSLTEPASSEDRTLKAPALRPGSDASTSLISVLRLNIGRSHPVSIEIPNDVLISYKQVNFIKTILIYGISLERVTKLASEIRALSPVERYKGKGFRLSDEFVTIKAKK